MIAQPWKITYCNKVHYIWHINLRVKNGGVLKIFCLLVQKGSFVAHSPYNISYTVLVQVERSTASIFDLSGIFTSARTYWLWTSLPYDIYYIYVYVYIYPLQEGYKRVTYPSWQGQILFIPCLGYSDLARILLLPTEPKRHTFSALANAKSSRSLGSGCDLMLTLVQFKQASPAQGSLTCYLSRILQSDWSE